MRKIKVCPGIGDNIFLMQKLVNSGEKFDFRLSGGNPRRGKPLFDMLPQVVNSAEYDDVWPYKMVKAGNVQRSHSLWSSIAKKEFFLSCNDHLERGFRIEKFLPDLPTSYRLDYDLSAATVELPEAGGLIGIYGSSYSTARAWGFWEAPGWYKLIEAINGLNKGYKFIIIGADFDTDMNDKLCGLLKLAKIPHINATGLPLVDTAVLLKKLHYFFAFPSGLPILANTLGVPCTMFYPRHLNLMMNAWASPEDIATGFYKGCQFCEPEKIFKWAVENNKI